MLTIPHLDLFPGEALALLGPSGAGKSTLAGVIGNFLPPHATVNGHWDASTQHGATPRVGVVSQDAFGALNPLDRVEKQVALTAGSIEKAHELLRSVTIPEDLYDRFPLQLSGGQRQRASIAFALGGNPDILIADEVTSALDPAATVKIVETLGDMLRKYPHRAVVFISHDIAAARALCQRAVILTRNQLGPGFVATVAEAGTW